MVTSLLLFSLMAPPIPVDAIYHNGKVWASASDTSSAQAIAVWKGRIVAVGSNDEVKSLAGADTKVLDLQGRRVVPGFYDSHVHFLGGGRSLAQVDLKDAADEAEFGRRLKAFDEKTPRDRWLLGGNWDHDRTFAGKLPTAELIDKYVNNRPVFIQRYDGHMAVVNTAALKMAKVTAETQDPPGGVIYRLADGKTPSGVLKDNAMSLVERLVPEPAEDEILESVRAALKACGQNGITSVQDMDGSSPETRRSLLRILQKLARQGELTVRIDLRWPIARYKEIASVGAMANFGNEYVRIGGVKGFMDGSLGSSTAKMFAPYVGESKNVGVYVTEPDYMRTLIRGADEAGLSVAIHAIGDQANSVLLDLFTETTNTNPPRDRRFRIEHVQHLRPEDYSRFKLGNVMASMQPYHVIDDGRWAEGRIGADRCRSSYAYRSLLDAGAVLAFGSDWPVAPLDPIVGLDAAVHRRTLGGKHPDGWFPEQKIRVAEALTAYTLGSAFAAHQEAEKGTLSVGKFADFVVLSRDILAENEVNRVLDTKIDLTVVGGKVVYQRGK